MTHGTHKPLTDNTGLNKLLPKEVIDIYQYCFFKIENFKKDTESAPYNACEFELNSVRIIYREAKITPKKTGQFVTFWKRTNNGIIQPYNIDESFGFFIVNIRSKNKLGQFVFPKSILIKKGIISSKTTQGKRGFRIYPPWDITQSKQALKTQKWQQNYFYEINNNPDLNKIRALFNNS